MKRLFSIVLSLVLTFSFTSTSFAAETNSYAIPTDTDTYMSYNLPNDAVVLYQSEDGIIYQSSVEDYQPRNTPPLHVRDPTTDLLHIKLRKIIEEYEATS